jgi:DNA polymerase
MPLFERNLYILDQKINDRGILIDLTLAENAIKIDDIYTEEVSNKLKKITDIENPNSPAQLRKWIGQILKKDIPSLAKESIELLLKEVGPGVVMDVLNLRKKLAKTSTKKYLAMVNCACESNRAHGLFQFYGANRTGRWAGRLIQLQNLPRNYMDSLDLARSLIRSGSIEDLEIQYDDISKVLSECIRTAFIPTKNKKLCVSDFSAIEARVLSWVAEEEWRLEVFRGHGKIYESSAAMMFGVPMESIKKGSPLRDRGKIAELALGYQGSLGALKAMGGEKMGLSDDEMVSIVDKWRKANPKIVKFWYNTESAAKKAFKLKERTKVPGSEIYFDMEGSAMTIELPSKKKLFYQSPSLGSNKFGKESLRYKGIDQTTGMWVHIDTYGGKLTENIVQAISRDLLAESLLNLDKNGFDLIMHVHDECVAEIPEIDSEKYLKEMNSILCKKPEWALDLPLGAEGYITNFYKKD